jgi:hypothetical protein
LCTFLKSLSAPFRAITPGHVPCSAISFGSYLFAVKVEEMLSMKIKGRNPREVQVRFVPQYQDTMLHFRVMVLDMITKNIGRTQIVIVVAAKSWLTGF